MTSYISIFSGKSENKILSKMPYITVRKIIDKCCEKHGQI